jgi:hypothetical protein
VCCKLRVNWLAACKSPASCLEALEPAKAASSARSTAHSADLIELSPKVSKTVGLHGGSRGWTGLLCPGVVVLIGRLKMYWRDMCIDLRGGEVLVPKIDDDFHRDALLTLRIMLRLGFGSKDLLSPADQEPNH